MSGRLDGRRALVTGSTRGIGRAIAEAFLREGARVAINSRDAAAAAVVAAQLGPDVVAVGGDVGTEAGAAAAVGGAAERLGGLDVLVNNAGMNIVGDSIDMPLESWERVLRLNLTGPFLCSQLAARLMIPAGSGSIVNIGSITSLTAFPRRAPYATSKAGLAMLTRVLAVEWAGLGVRVNAIAPGFVRTSLTENLVQQGKLDFDAVVRRTPMKRLGQPSEVAAAALYLASDESAFVTGETLAVDGGWLAYGFV